MLLPNTKQIINVQCIYCSSAHLVVKKRSGYGQPPVDGHYDGHATGAHAEETPQNYLPAHPYVLGDLWPRGLKDEPKQHAGECHEILNGQATQQELVPPVFPGPSQDEQCQHVAAYADGEYGQLQQAYE